jgi:hypothetical protein
MLSPDRWKEVRERAAAKVRAANDAKKGPRYDVNEDGCWIWLWATNGYGYPEERRRRWYYRQATGIEYPTGRGWTLHHECGARQCVNPDHAQHMAKPAHDRLHAMLRERGWRSFSVADRIAMSQELFALMAEEPCRR